MSIEAWVTPSLFLLRAFTTFIPNRSLNLLKEQKKSKKLLRSDRSVSKLKVQSWTRSSLFTLHLANQNPDVYRNFALLGRGTLTLDFTVDNMQCNHKNQLHLYNINARHFTQKISHFFKGLRLCMLLFMSFSGPISLKSESVLKNFIFRITLNIFFCFLMLAN